MTDHPIIFSASMVRALLDGRKSQTRLLAKAACGRCKPGPHFCTYCGDLGWRPSPWQRVQPGDRLWVRESFGEWTALELFGGTPLKMVAYKAGRAWITPPSPPVGDPASWPPHHCAPDDKPEYVKWRPSIHMPRWASRLTLTVTEVRRQRLHEISQKDALAEGLTFPDGMRYGSDPKAAFANLWDRLHGAGSWGANPEVIVLRFSVERRNIDASEAA